MKKAAAALAIIAGIGFGEAHSAEFKLDRTVNNKNVVSIEGKIVDGDMKKFAKVLWQINKGEKLWLLDLNSPGGDVMEAEKIAEWVHKQKNLAVSVNGGNICASACFLIFAAGEKKFAHEQSEISVHSVSSSNGEENIIALAMTTAMARDAHQMGVPDTIIGKMVTTKPSDLAVLNQKDLKAMKVVTFSDENME